MTTSAYQPSDYKTNIDQTDRHLHVTSGDKSIKVEEQSLDTYEIKDLLHNMLIEQRITNKYLAEFMGDNISKEDIT